MLAQALARTVGEGTNQSPLFVDLDGTLIASDLLLECLLLRAKHRPLDLLKVPFWLVRGRAYLKARLADDRLDVTQLPYRKELCEHLASERAKGRPIYLATAADDRLASKVAEHLGLFDGVLASDGEKNLKSVRKLDAIRKIAKAGFAYAGNSRDDLVIWTKAESAILVNAPRAVARQLQCSGKVEQVFSLPGGRWRDLVRVVRVHQWLKNLLVFVPLLTSFRITQTSGICASILAFVAFSLCASATYVTNDLLDIQSDRAHPRKRFRPLASGRLPIPVGIAVAATTLCLGLAVAAAQSFTFATLISAYLVITTTYSWYLKTRVLLDVIVLAGLYTIRIIGGAIAIGVPTSVWLLAFALFVFLSLALVKRCSELMTLKSIGLVETRGRNYEVNDLKVLWPMGVATAVGSVLVFALYINSADMPTHYRTPSLLWLVALQLFYWLGRLWIKTGRGEMSDDPLVYALTDFGSRVLIAGMVATTLAAYFLRLG
jgi:4-hydroxybenzoate polyprenyltransferase/phosphoserine phosphatase